MLEAKALLGGTESVERRLAVQGFPTHDILHSWLAVSL